MSVPGGTPGTVAVDPARAAPAPRRRYERPGLIALALVVLTAALYLPWLGYTDLVNEETRRAVIARNMMDSGDYLVPELGGRVYLSKPPLFNWLIAAASAPGGRVTEFTARLPSVVGLALLAVLMVFTAGRTLGSGARWFLGLSVVLTGELARKAAMAEIDVVFTLLVSAALWIWYALDAGGRRGLRLWLGPAVLVGAAVLTKREPALLFFYLGIGGFLLWQRRFLELLRPAHLASAALAAVLVGLWLVPLLQQTGIEAFAANMQREVVTRGLSPTPAAYLVHALTYPLEMLGAALPASPLLLALAWPAVRRRVYARHGRMLVFAALVVALNLPPYLLRADAAVRYVLPLFPTLIALAAMVLDTLIADGDAWPGGARRTQHALAAVLVGLGAVIAGAMLVLALPGVAPGLAGPMLPWPAMAALAGAGLAALVGLAWRWRRSTALLALLAVVGFGGAFRIAELTWRIPYEAERIAREDDDVPALLAELRARLPDGVRRVQALGEIPHALWFYDRQDTIVPAARLERTGTPASPYLLAWSARIDRIEPIEGSARRVARLPYEDGDLLLFRLAGGNADGAAQDGSGAPSPSGPSKR